MPKPLIIAHRGASELAQENSLEAIFLGIAQGAQMVEIDIQITKDQILVLNHNNRLKRFLPTIRIREHTYAELVNLGFELVTLNTAIRALPPNILLNLDLKCDYMDLALKKLINTSAIENRIYFDSPSPLLLQRYHFFFPLAKSVINSTVTTDPLNLNKTIVGNFALTLYQALLSFPVRLLFRRKALKTFPHYVSLLPKLCKAKDVNFYHSLGIGVFVATVNQVQDMRKFITMGVDGIKTDNPERLAKVITSQS